jgi:hypothetical protein
MKNRNLLLYADLLLCVLSIGCVTYALYRNSPLIDVGIFMLIGSNALTRLLKYSFGSVPYFSLGMSFLGGIFLLSSVNVFLHNELYLGITFVLLSFLFISTGIVPHKENHIY